ncbi:hypothetical protein H4582DRAFT_2062813 [Lactarius indigo]|nr:hypothetical protein H4582DRAFT_2062813 [Lactarius indigo]
MDKNLTNKALYLSAAIPAQRIWHRVLRDIGDAMQRPGESVGALRRTERLRDVPVGYYYLTPSKLNAGGVRLAQPIDIYQRVSEAPVNIGEREGVGILRDSVDARRGRV